VHGGRRFATGHMISYIGSKIRKSSFCAARCFPAGHLEDSELIGYAPLPKDQCQRKARRKAATGVPDSSTPQGIETPEPRSRQEVLSRKDELNQGISVDQSQRCASQAALFFIERWIVVGERKHFLLSRTSGEIPSSIEPGGHYSKSCRGSSRSRPLLEPSTLTTQTGRRKANVVSSLQAKSGKHEIK